MIMIFNIVMRIIIIKMKRRRIIMMIFNIVIRILIRITQKSG